MKASFGKVRLALSTTKPFKFMSLELGSVQRKCVITQIFGNKYYYLLIINEYEKYLPTSVYNV